MRAVGRRGLLVGAAAVASIGSAKAITPAVELLLFSGGGITVPQGLVGYWPFNEGAGTIAADNSGNGNNGTLINAPTWVLGQIKRALNFSATQRVSVPAASAVSLLGDFTIAAWVLWSGVLGTGSYSMILAHDNIGAANLGINSSSKLEIGKNSIASILAAPATFPVGGWHHVACTRSGSAYVLYIDGVSVASGTSVLSFVESGALVFGGTAAGLNLLGSEDDVRLYNRPLAATEIQQIYNAGLQGRP